MGYGNEWLLFESGDDIDEMEHRQPSEEFLFYHSVAGGDVGAVRENCEMGRFVESDGVGILSKDPV
ncbi:MAG: AraC family transcriptional regulator, partial [Lachnospiraceae bacterium]|nr:AraC family transcriptional regulator [Lachnospiraceae bacterium]